ncbi:MAG: cupin domain-containing protein [Aureliella sp.]
MAFINLQNEPEVTLAPGVVAQTPHGEQLMFSVVSIDENGEVPLHSHPHEQGGYVIEGKLRLVIDGDEQILRPGQMYLIPGDVPHSASGVDGAVRVLDVFAPVREDYAEKRRALL